MEKYQLLEITENPYTDVPGVSGEKIDASYKVKNISTINFKQGTFTIASTGGFTVGGLGFTPKVVHFQMGSNAGTIFSSGVAYGAGIESYYANDLGAGMVVGNNYCIYYSSTTFGFKTTANFVSMNSDGFSINVTNYFGTAYPIYYYAQ